MKISPSVLCVVMLPLAALAAISGAVFLFHRGGTANDTVPTFWLYMFLGGSPSAAGIAGILFSIRRKERTPLLLIDRIAVVTALLAALAFAGIMFSMYLATVRLEHATPNPYQAPAIKR